LVGFGRHTITGLLRNQNRTQQDGSADDRFYAQDRLEVGKVFQQVRWDIEVNFRDEKTILGVGQAQVRSESSNQNAPALAVTAYAMLLLASVKTYGAEGKPDTFQSPLWYRRKSQERVTTNELINQLRYELWAEPLSSNFTGFSQKTNPDQNGLKCDHPLASAVFLSVQ
jgi:hypothetical protein